MMQNDSSLSSNASATGDAVAGASSQSSKKRKAPSGGSRGVASLTPDQLAKKRANDRDAQRAIRERTKHQIESLERQIQELTSQQPYQELQTVIRQKEAIQAENDEIRRRLASILAIIQPVIGAHGLTDLATAAQSNSQADIVHHNNAFHQDQYLNGNPSSRAYVPSPDLSSAMGDTSSYPPPFSQDDTSSENTVWLSSRDALSTQRHNLHRGLELNDSGERLSFNFLLDSTGQRPAHMAAHSNSQSPTAPRSGYSSMTPSFQESPHQPWLVLPKHVAATCTLDTIMLNFMQARKGDIGKGGAGTPSNPSVLSLLNPKGNRPIDPLSQLMTDIISTFPSLSGLPEQAATLFIMFTFIRWQISPTREHYERLPDWLTPRPSQIFTPHPAWMDYIFYPSMRDKMIANQVDYPFENFFLPFTVGLSVNWPYDPIDCLISTSERDEPMINPVFERHIRRLDNWSLGPAFSQAFPALAHTARIKPKDGRASGVFI